MNPDYQVDAYLSEDQRHSAYVIDGLLKLEAQGKIVLRIKPLYSGIYNRLILENGKPRKIQRGYPWCPELLITEMKSGRKKRIGIDLQDWSHFFSAHALHTCDIIFKRAYPIEEKSKLFDLLNTDIRPFGPNYSLNIKDSRMLKIWKRVRLQQLLLKSLANPRKFIRAISDRIKPMPYGRKVISPYRYLKDTPPDYPYIFFQVAYHDWGPNSEAEYLNQQRADLIRALKKEFKEKFVGGMFFKGEIPERYQDCLTEVNPIPENYRAFVQSAAIVISTNGFGQSIPWKLIEYLQWGCCIVSETNAHSFRDPIREKFYLEFDNPNMAIEQCQILLENESLRNNFKVKAQRYFKDYIEPSASLYQVIKESFSEHV